MRLFASRQGLVTANPATPIPVAQPSATESVLPPATPQSPRSRTPVDRLGAGALPPEVSSVQRAPSSGAPASSQRVQGATAQRGLLDALCKRAEELLASSDPLTHSLAKDYRLSDDLAYIRSMRSKRLRLTLDTHGLALQKAVADQVPLKFKETSIAQRNEAVAKLPPQWKGLIGNLSNKDFRSQQPVSERAVTSPNYKTDNGAIGDAYQLLDQKINQLTRTANFWNKHRSLVEPGLSDPSQLKAALRQHANTYRKAFSGEQIGIKLGLELAGCVMLPPRNGLAGMFPQREYVVTDNSLSKADEFELLTDHANKLVQRYRFLDTQDDQRITQKKLGCVCIMFAKERGSNGESIYVPFFGLSRGPASGDEDIQKYLHRMGLPRIDLQIRPSDPNLMENRFNILRDHFEDLKSVGLKTPSKQAMISYMQFIDGSFKDEITSLIASFKLDDETQLYAQFVNEETARLKDHGQNLDSEELPNIKKKAERYAKIQITRLKEQKLVANGDVDSMALNLKSIESWNSLKCAEPAAIMAAAQLYYRMADMEISFPYEGKSRIEHDADLNQTEHTDYLAKETCGRCAISEAAFGGLTGSGQREHTNMREADISSKNALGETLHVHLTQNVHGNKILAGQQHSKVPYYDPDTKLAAMQRILAALDHYELGQMSSGSVFKTHDTKVQALPTGPRDDDFYNTFWSNGDFLNKFFAYFKGGGG